MIVKKNKISRRKFVGQASCAALGSISLLNTLTNLTALNASAIGSPTAMAGGDYKALVCLFLSGGNDSFNMLVPTDDPRYNDYRVTRSNQALDRNELVGLNPLVSTPGSYGLHSAMPRMGQLFNQGKVSFINNVGTLVEHVDKATLWNPSSRLPVGLFSHSDQTQQWQTAVPHDRSAIGWGGRIADIVKSMNDNDQISMNISMSGTNIFQTGNNTIEYTLDPERGSVGIVGHGEFDQWNVRDNARTAALDAMLDHHYADAFKQAYVDPIRTARDGHILFQEGLEQVPDFNTAFPDDPYRLGQRFEMIGKTMAMKDFLGVKRQIFFVDFGGWDHHDELLGNQQDMLGMVDEALGSFNDLMEELNLQDCVTTFAVSEFGRTLTSNGNGTDHAWGGNVFVMGGDQLNGGQMFGSYPSLALDNDLEIGGGVLIPTTSADEYFAELAMWFGVSSVELATIFPNLGNFYSIGSSQPPIGFLNV